MPAADENERREEAFLALIRYTEFARQERSDAYHMSFGNIYFGDLSKHPGQMHKKWGHRSDAAGAYQIKSTTYELAVKHGIAHNLSQASQDAIAKWLIRRAGAQSYIWVGNLDAAFALLTPTWSSLPGGGSPQATSDEAKQYFWHQLGEPQP